MSKNSLRLVERQLFDAVFHTETLCLAEQRRSTQAVDQALNINLRAVPKLLYVVAAIVKPVFGILFGCQYGGG